MVRRDSDRGYYTGALLQTSASHSRGGVPREQLRERSRASLPTGATPRAPLHTDPSTCGMHRQEVQGPKPESGPGTANRLCLRYTTQPSHAAGRTDRHRLVPLSRIPRPSLGLPAPDTPAARRPTPPWSVNSIKRPRMPWDPQPGQRAAPPVSYRARMPLPPSKGGMQPRFFAPPPRWSEQLLGVAGPKPRPLTRPPPRSLVYKPPTQPSSSKVKPLGLITVRDLPSRQQVPSESRPHLPTKTPKPQVRSLALVSRASQETNRKEACLSDWQEILQLMGSASGLQSSLANSKYPQALLKKS